ncbi:MAG: ATPase [Methanobrevibacter sp.]|nr:ATPase [Methanobrevibacter sp.]MBQ6627475.1 ATPase [Methanobrevibacter sp.]
MQCHYHPEREGTDVCAICGKSICKECGLEIAGKIYCKDCLEKIVGLSLDNSPQSEVESEPVYVEEQPIEENIYQPQEEYEIPYAQEEEVQEYKAISDDSPYNIKDSIEYSGGLESSYLSKEETIYQEEPQQVTQNEYEPQEVIQQQPTAGEQEYIYPDHDYEPPKTSARQELEDKYEKYLDDLYFDENEMPLGEQLAKDEEQYGSLTKKEYAPRPVEEKPQASTLKQEVPKKPTSRPETPEEMEARIRAEIAAEQGLKVKKEETGIHNINYKDEKEPMGAVDILLTVILLIVILIVIYYIIYLFLLQATYPTFIDAVYGLKNPQNVINAVLSK